MRDKKQKRGRKKRKMGEYPKESQTVLDWERDGRGSL